MKFDSELEKQYIPTIEKLFKEDFGFKVISSQENANLGRNYYPYHFLSIQVGRFQAKVLIEIKGNIAHLSQIKKIMKFVGKTDEIVFLVAYSIDEKIKQKLRKMKVGFCEMNKEVFFPLDFVLEGRESHFGNKIIREKGFHAEGGMKMLLYFVCKPEALNFTQRELAERLAMSLGAVNKGLKSLEEKRLILIRGRKRYLGKFQDIVESWRKSFQYLEFKNYSIGKFSPVGNDFYETWNRILVSFDSYWGGEAAASIRTQYLKPALFSIYTYNDTLMNLVKEFRLKKDTNGIIEIFKCFWPEELNNSDGTVPDFVIYCELLNSNIDRNIETAEILKERISQRIKEYEF